MSRESLFAARLEANAPLMALLPGGVYQAGELGLEGITRDVAPAAFDANGYLETAALVRERSEVPDGIIRDFNVPLASTIQIVETWFYGSGTQEELEPIRPLAFALLQGWQIDDGFEVFLVNVLRSRDTGALNGSPLLRMDWQVNSILSGS